MRLQLDSDVEVVPDTFAWKMLLTVVDVMARDARESPKSRERSRQLLSIMKSGLGKSIRLTSEQRMQLSRYSAEALALFIKRPELFLIPRETWRAMDHREVSATISDMEELGIANLPYSTLDIGMPADTVLRHEDTGIASFTEWQLRFRFKEGKFYMCTLISPKGIGFDLEMLLLDNSVVHIAKHAREYLIVLLATRNATRTRVKDRLLTAGVGAAKRNKYRALYTTTISLPPKLPAELNGEGATRAGYSVRPHLRRGHIRQQKHGPRLQFTKSIWIEPCFVNADADFVSSRTAYNTSVTLPAEILKEQPPE